MIVRSRHPLRSRRRILVSIPAALALLLGSAGCNLPYAAPREDYAATFEAQLTLNATPIQSSATAEPVETVPAEPTSTSESAGNPTAALPPVFPENPPQGRIVYTCYIDGFDNICLMNADGSNITRLTDAQATEFYASISPDGTEIVFSSRREGSFRIYGMDMEGGDLRRLSEGSGSHYAPEISPDGSQIVFTVESGRSQIWVMSRDGSNPHTLTNTGSNIDPTWSPDGAKIAFASNRSGSQQLWVMNSDGSGERQVTDLPDMGGRSSWSADGTTLAFYAGPRGDRNIYTIDVNGSDLRQLTNGGDNLGPSFSLDGAWITFASFRDGNNEIYVIRPDGTEQTRLTANTHPDWQPRWGR